MRRFFESEECCILFILALKYIWNELPKQKNYGSEASYSILTEFIEASLKTLN